jgi:hypothetical protein
VIDHFAILAYFGWSLIAGAFVGLIMAVLVPPSDRDD